MADSNVVILMGDDVHGAALGDQVPEQLKMDGLKRWLHCRGATVSGNKAELVRKIHNYISSGKADKIIDPNNGINLQRKKEKMDIAPGANVNFPLTAPPSGWVDGLSDVPDFTYHQIYSYLVLNKAVTLDGKELGGFRSLKALKFFKEGYVQQLKSNF